MNEKRAHIRYPMLNKDISISVITKKGLAIGTLYDVSYGGVSFIINQPIESDTFTVNFAINHQSFRFHTDKIRTTRMGDKVLVAGCFKGVANLLYNQNLFPLPQKKPLVASL